MARLLSLFLLLFVVSAQLGCQKFECNSDLDWTEGVCGTVDPTNTTIYYINPDYCSPGTYCDMTDNATCIESYPSPPPQSYPGEACGSESPCVEGVECVDGWCASLVLNATCTYGSDCGLGMLCSDGVCVALKEVGESCHYSIECIQSATCETERPAPDTGNGTCVGYFSLPVGTFVNSCPQIAPFTLGSNVLCESTLCSTSMSEGSAGGGFCASAVMSPGAIPARCGVSDFFCYSTPDPISSFVNNEPCQCSLDGHKYCSLFPGDPQYQRFLKLLKEFLYSPGMKTCNTVNCNTGIMNTILNCN